MWCRGLNIFALYVVHLDLLMLEICRPPLLRLKLLILWQAAPIRRHRIGRQLSVTMLRQVMFLILHVLRRLMALRPSLTVRFSLRIRLKYRLIVNF
jgi:hypothetical protein